MFFFGVGVAIYIKYFIFTTNLTKGYISIRMPIELPLFRFRILIAHGSMRSFASTIREMRIDLKAMCMNGTCEFTKKAHATKPAAGPALAQHTMEPHTSQIKLKSSPMFSMIPIVEIR